VAIPELILIVDDDESVRQGLSRLLTSVGFAVNTFASAEEYLSSDQLERADCLILDIRMSGMSGIELQRQLVANQSEVPVIFITAHEEETERVQALVRPQRARRACVELQPDAVLRRCFAGDATGHASAAATWSQITNFDEFAYPVIGNQGGNTGLVIS
jgi:CheY-like chemotaxis protein